VELGKPLTTIIEFAIAIVIDQAKFVPVQTVIWWTVIRRCGYHDPGEFEVWDDNEIFQGGIEPSLL
jgi:hypothetical protein